MACTEDMKVGFSKRLGFAEPSIRKLVMAGLVIDIGDIGNYEQVTEKEWKWHLRQVGSAEPWVPKNDNYGVHNTNMAIRRNT